MKENNWIMGLSYNLILKKFETKKSPKKPKTTYSCSFIDYKLTKFNYTSIFLFRINNLANK